MAKNTVRIFCKEMGGIKMRTLRDSIAEEMKNPEFRREWEALEPGYQLIRAMLDGRQVANMTQQQSWQMRPGYRRRISAGWKQEHQTLR